MTLISKTISSLINGVSQQPPILRLPSQGESQVNGYSSPVDGLLKRPGTQHGARISPLNYESSFLHIINRSETERYLLVIDSGNFHVFDFNGNEMDLVLAADTAYLVSSNPFNDFVAVTLADSTFILNKSKVVASLTDTATGAIKGTKQLFSDLPTSGMADGDIYKIQGNASDSFSSYYVRWTSATSVWSEVTIPGQIYKLNPSTMPYELAKTGTHTFTLRTLGWKNRVAGDNITNPFPSFVGRALKDLFFIDNRMCLVTDDVNVYSEVGVPENFFRTTVTTLVDSDPTEGAATTNQVAIIQYAVPWNGAIVEFSDTTQFLVPKDVSLKPPGVPLKSTTQYESSLKARPVASGQEVFFPIPKGSYSGLRSYYVMDVNDNAAADEVTAHVPHYLPGNIFKLATSTNENVLLMLSLDYRNRVYLYQFYNQRTDSGIQRAQSAFHYWEFASTDRILAIETIGSVAHLWVQRNDGLYHETLPLNSGQVEPEFSALPVPFQVLLDRKVRLTGVYNASTNTTTWTLPYPDTGDFMAIKGAGWPNGLGANIEVTRPTPTTVAATGDYSAHPCIIGRKFMFSYTFSEFVVSKANGSSSVAILTGTMSLYRLLISYFQTGYFKVTTVTRKSSTYTDVFARTLGDPANTVGEVSLEDGIKEISLSGEPRDIRITLSSDSYLPCKFLNAAWEAEFITKSQGI